MRVMVTNGQGEIICSPLLKKERFPPGAVVITNQRAELRTAHGPIILCDLPEGFSHYSTTGEKITFRDGSPIPVKLTRWEKAMNRINKRRQKNGDTLF